MSADLHLVAGGTEMSAVVRWGAPADDVLWERVDLVGDLPRPLVREGAGLVGGVRHSILTRSAPRLRAADRVTVWSGSGLRDQLFLLWATHVLDAAGVPPERVVLRLPEDEEVDHVISPEDADALVPCPLDAPVRDHLREAWDAVSADTPAPLLTLLARDAPPLRAPTLALARLLDRYPDAASGLPYWDLLLLRAAAEVGPSRRDVVGEVMASWALDEVRGRDAVAPEWLHERLDALADPRRPNPLVTVSGEAWTDEGSTAAVTEAGRAVLAGACAVDLRAIDDRVLRVRLTPARWWWRTAEGLREASAGG